MVVLKKISPSEQKFQEELERKRQEFIRKGGMMQAELVQDYEEELAEQWFKVCINMNAEMRDEIDCLLDRKKRETRTQFILDAIQEKIDRIKDE